MISLDNTTLRCRISAQAGGSITGFWHGSRAVLMPWDATVQSTTLAPTRLPTAGSYPLVPYSNRIGYARLNWQGRIYSLQPNFAPEPHAIHGVGWQRAWDVVRHDALSATLAYTHTPDDHWPFAFEVRQTIALEADTLRMHMIVTNLASTPAPVGLGWHPFFVKHESTHITFAARGRWEMGVDQLPTQLLASGGINTHCRALTVDHCFNEWTDALVLRDDDTRCEVRSNLHHLVVYTHPGIKAIAIEPVSHANNALNLFADNAASAEMLGVQTLASGGSLSAWMSIKVSAP
jgi:aldose 1-epimerase